MILLLLGSLVSLFAVSLAGSTTVTHECWFDVEVKDLDGPGEHYRGQFVIAVFGEAAPMTALNFVKLTEGFKRAGKELSYKNTLIHRIVPDFVLQMGDITKGDGTGSTSIYGDKFNDEEFILSHQSLGMVSMANHGKDTNGSQFFILLTKARWLDEKHVVFGKVKMGYDLIKVLGEVPSDPDNAMPKKTVKIIDCGVDELENKYDLTEEQMNSETDL